MFTRTILPGTNIPDAWNGNIQHFGKSVFSVVGVCGFHPVVTVHRSENHVQAEQCVLNWETGKVLHFLGNPNPIIEDHENETALL